MHACSSPSAVFCQLQTYLPRGSRPFQASTGCIHICFPKHQGEDSGLSFPHSERKRPLSQRGSISHRIQRHQTPFGLRKRNKKECKYLPKLKPYGKWGGIKTWDTCLATQLDLTLCDPMDCNPPGSSVHRILQARILEWVAISSSRGIFPTQGSNPRLQD